MDEMTKMMDLKLSQAKVQREMNEELAYLKDVFTKHLPQPAASYYSPRGYCNGEYPNQAAATRL